MILNIKRIYEAPSSEDGVRILVDRLWPRGTSKEKAKIDFWLKEIAPSTQLRKWFNHEPDKWEQFKTCYFMELADSGKLAGFIQEIMRGKKVTLLFSSKEKRFNNATALKQYIETHLL